MLAFAALVAGRPAVAQAQTPPPDVLEVEAKGDSLREVAPGEVVTAAIHVTNHSEGELMATASVELPGGWSLVLPVTGGPLEAGERVTRLVVVRVPGRAPVGTHEVKVGFRSAGGASGKAAIRIHVKPTYKLDVQLAELPALARPGQALKAYVQVVNRSNGVVRATLEGTGGDGLSVGLDSAQLRLPPGAVRRVGIQVEVAEDLKSATRPLLSIAASIQEAPKVYKDAQFIDIVPVAPVNASEWEYLSSRVAVRMAGRGMQGGPQVEIAGGGKPFKHLGHEVEYLARIPYRSLPLRADLRETYRLRYKTERFEVAAGDYVYSLSPLSTSPRQGRGGEVSARLGAWTVGSYYQQGRYYRQGDLAAAAYVRRSLGGAASMSAYYLARRGVQGGQLAGVRGRVRLPKSTKLDAEMGVSTQGEQLAAGSRLSVAGGFAGLTYDLRFLHTGLGFVGNRNGQAMDVRSARLAYSLARGLRLEGNWATSYQEHGGPAGSTYGTASRGAGLRLDKQLTIGKARLFTGFESRRRVIQSEEMLFERSSSVLTLRGGLRGKRSGVRVAAEVGHLVGTGLQTPGSTQRYDVRGDWSRRGIDLYAGVEYRSGAQVYSALAGQQWTLRAGGQLKLSAKSHFIAGASVYSRGSVPLMGRVSAHGRFEHELASGHRLEVEGRYYAGGRHLLGGMPTYTLSYSVPVGLPVRQKTPPALVQGQVLRGEDGKPLSDVLIRLGGMSVLTDERGRFAFRGVPGGEHLLMVSPSSLEAGWTTRRPMPMKVSVEGEHPARLDIHVRESGSVSGRVILYERPGGMVSRAEEGDNAGAERELVKNGGISGVVLELSNGSDTRRFLSGANGQFSMTGLYPGRWTLRAYPEGLPEHHYIEEEVVELNVRASRGSSVRVKVLPKDRNVRIIESGTLEENP